MRAISTALFSLLAAGILRSEEPKRHVVLVVWDGMRPDFISDVTTPHLWALAQRGVFFTNHHPVYASSTEVNGTALATGLNPEHSHVIANTEYRPKIDPQKAINIENPGSIRKGDLVDGPYINGETLAEFLHRNGVHTAIAGSKQVALLHDRFPRPNDPGVSPILYDGAALPPRVEIDASAAQGENPPAAAEGTPSPNKFSKDAWTTRALTQVLWKDGVPAYSVLWLAEPDFSQHATGPGSEQSLKAIRSSDDNLGRVLDELDRRGVRESTDVIVVSDHGFSTIGPVVDSATELSTYGFPTSRVALGGLEPGRILVQSNNGHILLYVGGHDPELIRKLAFCLETLDWPGVIFSRLPIEGTLPLAEARIASPQAPDLLVSMRWTLARSATGAPGIICSDGTTYGTGQGAHASLCPTEMRNTLVAGGPDFKRGVRDALPSGNVDIVPTILWILGYHDESQRRDGRVLGEALTIAAPPLASYTMQRLSAERRTRGGRWSEYLEISEVNGVRYLDEGNGAFVGDAR